VEGHHRPRKACQTSETGASVCQSSPTVGTSHHGIRAASQPRVRAVCREYNGRATYTVSDTSLGGPLSPVPDCTAAMLPRRCSASQLLVPL
jgi:hypothetical protein